MKKSKIIGFVLTILCIVLCLYIAIEVIVASSSERPPRFFGVSISNVPTSSMEDTIHRGDFVLFKKASYNDIVVNDIIVYRSKTGDMAGNYIIHRVIEVHDDYLITQGDNRITNPLPDTEQITSDMFIGKFVCVLGFMKVFSKMNRSVAFLILILIFLALVILQATSLFLKHKKNQLEEKKKQDALMDIELLKKQILEEELAKIRNQKKEE
ncbi:MAG: signal peptidase I [Anaeroplasmataceae bacterium]|nr:signal peptidase I [Anaeroplasmataceae bacterium]MDE5867358.1 signal peptidase I [Anaeroplasmataceae bacterium]